MFVPIQAAGSRPPLVLVHGLFGAMPFGPRLAAALGPDQPLYGFDARGFTDAPHRSVEEMARDYLAALRHAVPRGPYVLGGLCMGSLVALEMASQLAAQGEAPRSVVMIEPAAVLNLNPPQRKLDADLERAAAAQIRDVARGWFVQYAGLVDRMPFDVADPARLERAAEVGVELIFAYERYAPKPYAGRVDIIACEQRARLITNPDLPWRQDILKGTWTMTSMPCSHDDVFLRAAGQLFQAIVAILNAVTPLATQPAGAASAL
jgi:thioesterase domain-containing protein